MLNKILNLWKFGYVIPHRQFLVKEKTEIPRDRIRHHRGRDVGERHSVTFPELLPSAHRFIAEQANVLQ